MDSRAVVDAAGVCNGENGLDAKDKEDSVTEALLPPPPLPPPAKREGGGGGMKGKRTRSFVRRKKVQWNDRNGDKLVHVLEFQPSCGVWTRGHKIVTCIQICCCLRSRRSHS